jgi:hypothetical protein
MIAPKHLSQRRSRKTVTLVAGFKCDQGFVICADSQETAGDYRVSRLKLNPWQAGHFSIAMAGSGNNGELLDSFEVRLKRNLDSARELRSIDALKEFIEHEILDFRKTEAKVFPKRDQQMRFIIGANSASESRCAMWSTSASRLADVDTYALVGFEDERYEYAISNLFRSDITIAQGIFLGLYVMWLAEQTSNYVKSPITVAVLKNGLVESQPKKKIEALLARVKIFSSQFESFFLACPDTGIQPTEFAGKLKEFIDTIWSLRKEYVEESVGQFLDEGLDRVIESFPLVAPGTTIIVNPTPQQAAVHTEMQQRLQAGLRENFGYVQEPERILENLGTVGSAQRKLYEHFSCNGPELSVQDHVDYNKAVGELFQASLMGPHKVSEGVCVLVSRVNEILQATEADVKGYATNELRDATTLLRVAAIAQHRELIRLTIMQSNSQMSVDQR